MITSSSEETRERYIEAVNNFIESVKKDINVIAVIIMGSLSNDIVWEKSDIDSMVIVRDQKINVKNFCIDADGIVLNVDIIERSDFSRMLERATGGSIFQSFFSRAKVMYTTDPSITELTEQNKEVGELDAQRSVIFCACDLVCLMEKCEKWLYVKKDYDYCRYYILKAAEAIARVEICLQKEAPLREVLQRARQINPKLVERFYDYPLNTKLTHEELEKLITEIDEYLISHIEFISAQIIDFMSDGEIMTVNMLCRQFRTDGHFIVHLLDYLASKGVIDKVSQTIRLTPKSRPVLEEVAYMYISK